MENQPPQELTDLLSKIREEDKHNREIHKVGEEIYKYANSILEEHDTISAGKEDSKDRKIPRQTKLVPIPNTKYATGLHNCIPIIYEPKGVKIGLFGLNDKDRRYLNGDLFTMEDNSLGYKMFFIHDFNHGLIRTVDGLQQVRRILDYIKTNLDSGNVEEDRE